MEHLMGVIQILNDTLAVTETVTSITTGGGKHFISSFVDYTRSHIIFTGYCFAKHPRLDIRTIANRNDLYRM
ncbi:hypothetical protein RvY_12182 [Ramazzottius varieornatus]|uniref:Uncharacterized protein n=1 Tax=Ramazzottius varieornatus TaxID=947166 RepID=A0A1D1VKZ3_RAMVA|nr:hypothetical protein RvY_12182 [Ramazzottius varieornatus]